MIEMIKEEINKNHIKSR